MVVDRCDEAFTTVEPTAASTPTCTPWRPSSPRATSPATRACAPGRCGSRSVVHDLAAEPRLADPRALRRRLAAAARLQRRQARRPFRPYGATVGPLRWSGPASPSTSGPRWATDAPGWPAPRRPVPVRRGRARGLGGRRQPRLRLHVDWDGHRSSASGCTGWPPRPPPPPPRCTPSTGEESYAAWYADLLGPHRLRAPRPRGAGPGGTSSTPRTVPRGPPGRGKPDTYHALQATLVPRLPARADARHRPRPGPARPLRLQRGSRRTRRRLR